MPELPPAWIAKVLDTPWSSPVAKDFTSVCTDSRTIKPGTLFVAIKGPTRHGQEFLAQAKDSGATGALVEALQPVDLPQIVVPDSIAALQKLAQVRRNEFKGTVIGITGSSGKTSTKELLAHLLGPSVSKTTGNFNNHLGVPLTILGANLTAKFWVIEAGVDKTGEMDPLVAMIQPDAVLLTFVGASHLEFFKRIESTAAEKSKLLMSVPANGIVALHERELSAFEAFQYLKSRVLVAGEPKTKLPANYHPTPAIYNSKPDGWELSIDSETYIIPLWTPGMAQNAVLCILIARGLGVSAKTISEHLLDWPGAPLRGQWVRFNEGPASQRIYLDAYNCAPEGLVDSFWKFEKQARPETQHLFVLSAMGELGDAGLTLQKNAAAKAPLRPQDRVCLVGQNTGAMIEGLKLAGMKDIQLTMCPTVEDVKPILAYFEGDCFIKGSHYGSRLFTLAALCTPLSLP